MSRSADRARTRALRLLAREHYAEYAEIYEKVRAAAPDRYRARGQARMQLRHRYPDRYLELHALERAGPGTDVPAGIRSKSWQRAVARLADLRAPAYRKLFGQFRAQGMNRPAAYDRAMAILREADSDLFTRMLTEEYQLWLAVGAASQQGASAVLPGKSTVTMEPMRINPERRRDDANQAGGSGTTGSPGGE